MTTCNHVLRDCDSRGICVYCGALFDEALYDAHVGHGRADCIMQLCVYLHSPLARAHRAGVMEAMAEARLRHISAVDLLEFVMSRTRD